MGQRDLVVVGGSAGGINAIREFLSGLTSDLPASVVVVLHRADDGAGNLAAVLGRASTLPVAVATNGARLAPGRVYLAPPGTHTVIRDDHLVLARSAKVNRARPAIDPLFLSAARWFGPRVVGIVFSGSLDDGAAGLAAIQDRGGRCLVQDPAEALFAGMPGAALVSVPSAKALGAAELASAVTELAGQPVPDRVTPPELDLVLVTDAAEQADRQPTLTQPGSPVTVACPECRGAMRVIVNGTAMHYRCHVGHAYSPQNLLAAQLDTAESALWTVVSILEEREILHRTMAESAGEPLGDRYRRAGSQAGRAADAVRAVIQSTTDLNEPVAEAGKTESGY